MWAWKIIIPFGLLSLIVVIGFVLQRPEEKAIEPETVAVEEQGLIESWITANDLNKYGDPKDLVYIGGTPLFDEATGQSIDKYEYILRNHPDKPWTKVDQ